MRDLRSWLKQVEDLGELQVIRQQLDWNEEAAALNYIVGHKEGAPALMYENIKDTAPGFRSLYNLFGTSKERVAAAFGFPAGKSYTELINMVRTNFRRKVPPRVVPADRVPCNENLLAAKDADITIIDADKEWIFTKEEIVSKSKNSPFIGRKLKGRVEATICNGKIVYQA